MKFARCHMYKVNLIVHIHSCNIMGFVRDLPQGITTGALIYCLSEKGEKTLSTLQFYVKGNSNYTYTGLL